MRKAIAIMALIFGLSTAAPARAGDGEVLGTLMGAGLGGLIGNQFGHGGGRVAATFGGVILGGMVGNSIGSNIDYNNRYYGYGRPAYASYYPGPVVYQTAYVPNYVAQPAPPPEAVAYYNSSAETYCREYTQRVRIDGHVQESYGTACLQPDGSWRIVQ